MTVQADVSTGRPVGGPPAREPDRLPRVRAARPVELSPLLAVCGLCGGAGTSTLSYLVARFAVAQARGHVLVCDTGGPAGGLAACARVRSPQSLLETAGRVARGQSLPGGPYAVDEPASASGHQLRIIATGPQLDEDDTSDGLPALLAMARSEGVHALTVVDCGTLQREADRVVLRSASHVAWVLPATAGGAHRAELVLAAVDSGHAGRELVVARRDTRERTAGLRELRALAERRRAPLVLVPHLRDPADRPARALEEAQVALQAIVGALRR
jgi:hypothetical protein